MHDGVEVPALWFLERRGRGNEERGDDDRRHDIYQVDLHSCVVLAVTIAYGVVPGV